MNSIKSVFFVASVFCTFSLLPMDNPQALKQARDDAKSFELKLKTGEISFFDAANRILITSSIRAFTKIRNDLNRVGSMQGIKKLQNSVHNKLNRELYDANLLKPARRLFQEDFDQIARTISREQQENSFDHTQIDQDGPE